MGGVRFEAIPFTGIEPDPQEVAEAQELHELVLWAVDELSPRNRTATLLFYYDQLSVREVAAVLDISVTAAKGRLHKARGQLRERLSPLMAGARTEVLSKKEEKKMVSVTIADVIRREKKDEDTGRTSVQHIVVLLDSEGKRVLPLWISQWEGEMLAMGLRDAQVPRPLTHRFMASLLDAVGAELEEERIESLRDNTFYAVAKVRSGDSTYEVDARPSDAMALAVTTGVPIYAAEEVLEADGRAIPAGLGETTIPGTGLDAIMEPNGIIRQIDEWIESEAQKHSSPVQSEEQQEQARQELWHHLFGEAAGEAKPTAE